MIYIGRSASPESRELTGLSSRRSGARADSVPFRSTAAAGLNTSWRRDAILSATGRSQATRLRFAFPQPSLGPTWANGDYASSRPCPDCIARRASMLGSSGQCAPAYRSLATMS